LLPGVVLENAVEAAICAGRKRKQAKQSMGVPLLAETERFVIVSSAAGAIVRREPSPSTGRPAWRVLRLVALQPRKAAA